MASSIHVCSAFLFISILFLWGGTSARNDLTLKERAKGAVVVRAVIEKISTTLPLFNDCEWWNTSSVDRAILKRFLRNAAFVLTKDGKLNSKGGIWDIDASVLNSTSPSSCDLSMYQIGLDRANTNISILNMSLKKPMYSGLTAALCIHQYLSSHSMCQRVRRLTIRRGADHHMIWMAAIGTNLSRIMWQNKERDLQTQEKCSIASDVVFVMDSSLSVLPTDFEFAKGFILDFYNNYTTEITDDNSITNGIGVITYGRTARNPLPLINITHQTKDNIRVQINSIEHLDEVTNTADGLCLLAEQGWRNNSAVFQLAIVLTDGMSNRNATRHNCSGTLEEVARKIKKIYPHMLFVAIGIGDFEDPESIKELSRIASDNGLISTRNQYSDLRSSSNGFRYQICHTISADMPDEGDQSGSILKDQIMRWVIRNANISEDGISIRFCVMSGKITFYVAQGFPASPAINDMNATITLSDDRLNIVCQTEFLRDIFYDRRQKRQVSQSPAIYLSIEGQGNINTFTIQSGRGNISFDVNECESTPNPCDKSATCHNTDGSFYCVCNLGYSGDGLKCTSYLVQVLIFLVPSVFMGGLLLFACVLLIIVGICVRRQKPKSQKRNQKQKKAQDKKVFKYEYFTVNATTKIMSCMNLYLSLNIVFIPVLVL